MYVHNYASRLDIHLNFCLQTEISGTSVFRPHEEEYRVTGKEAYIHVIVLDFLGLPIDIPSYEELKITHDIRID